MKKLTYTVTIILLFFCTYSNSSEKKKIIENLKKINSLQFNFTQLSNDKQESGDCILVFPKRMRCTYYEERKEIIIKDDFLYLINKDENKNYNYVIKDTPFGIMLDKDDLIERLSKAEKYDITNDFVVAFLDINSFESIDIYFGSKSLLILGWKMRNFDRSTLEFMMKDIKVNISSNEKFEIPK